VDANFGAITELYRSEHLPTLQHSTQQTNSYILARYVEPTWSDVRIREVTPLAITKWIRELKLVPTPKASIRSVLSQCFELAALHNFIPQTERNPMSLVKIQGTGERQKAITILSEANFRKLVDALPEPLNLIVLVAGCLGLRVSEALALKWEDIDATAGTITIQRKFTHGALGVPKTTASGASLPLDATLSGILAVWKPKTEDSEWIFPSERTGGVRSASALLTKGIKPAARKAGLGRVTWHTLRHSCRTWLDSEGASVGTQKDLLRHADISTTMNRYGRALPPEMKKGHQRIVKKPVPDRLLKGRTVKARLRSE
jgi:integrase